MEELCSRLKPTLSLHPTLIQKFNKYVGPPWRAAVALDRPTSNRALLGPPDRDLGCSKCRYSAGGCSRCRNPSFRPRATGTTAELRQVAAEQRRCESRRRQEARRDERRKASIAAGATARDSLINRLRSHLGVDTSQDPTPSAVAAAAAPSAAPRPGARTAEEAELATPREQPPAKYRRVTKKEEEESSLKAIQAEDHEMRDVSPVEGPPPPGTAQKRGFLELLSDRMAERREARLSGASSPLAELAAADAAAPAAKRRRRSSGPHDPRFSPSTLINAQGSPEKPKINPRVALWEPPVSPYGLLEEELFHDPWKLLVACMLLNKTTASQVRRVIWSLFERWPTPAAVATADPSVLEAMLQPLGLFRRRATALVRMSQEYLEKDWEDPADLYCLGRYASDAYRIFCRGEWREVDPEDKDLARYKEWLESTGGLGTGLQRHFTAPQAAGKS